MLSRVVERMPNYYRILVIRQFEKYIVWYYYRIPIIRQFEKYDVW